MWTELSHRKVAQSFTHQTLNYGLEVGEDPQS